MGAMSKKLKKPLSLALLLLVFTASLFIAFDLCLRPLALTICTFEAKSMAAEAVNMVSIDLSPTVLTENIISVERDEFGRIVAITTNSNAISTFAAHLAQDIQDYINCSGEKEVEIYFAEVLGGQAMSGRGPAVTMRYTPSCVVDTLIRSEFETAGINQTRHSIVADIDIRVRVTLPIQTSFVDFHATSLLTETIIVGEVPETYLFSTEGDGVKYDLLPSS